MARLHAACFASPPPWSGTAIAGLLDQPQVFAISEPHGFALGRAAAGEAELLTLAVEPARRRLGLGRVLLQRFEAEGAARGATDAFLEVAADNAAALELYVRCGYLQVGMRPRYYTRPDGTRMDALILRHRLQMLR